MTETTLKDKVWHATQYLYGQLCVFNKRNVLRRATPEVRRDIVFNWCTQYLKDKMARFD